MLLTVKIRVTSIFLGDLPKDRQGVRRFRKKDGYILVEQWDWTQKMMTGANNLHLHLDIKNTVVPPPKFQAPSLHLHNRIYNRVKSELFESIRRNTILTMDFMIRETSASHPNPNQFAAILQWVGEWEGFSPFGGKFHFGQFDLISVVPKEMTELSLVPA